MTFLNFDFYCKVFSTDAQSIYKLDFGYIGLKFHSCQINMLTMSVKYYGLASLLILCVTIHIFGQENQPNRRLVVPENPGEIVILDSTINLYSAGDFFISGQPYDSILVALIDQGLKLVINVRTPEEMELIKANGFDEERFLDSLGIAYANIPIGGDFGFTKKSIEDINESILMHDGKVMVHCRAAGRATNAWMAWLINYYDTPVDLATTLGKKMQFSLYLEDLLGYELFFDKK